MPELRQPDTGRVLILGGQGVLGTMIAETFTASGWTAMRGGRRPESGADFRHVDLTRPETLEKAFAESDLIVNTVPDEQLVAERMVLDGGGALINVSAMAADAVRRLRQERGPVRGTVLMNAGIAPGLTNLLAVDLLAQHPDADEVELVFTVSTRSSVGPAGRSFAHRGLTAAGGRHRTAIVPLPEPFGPGAASASPSSTTAGSVQGRGGQEGQPVPLRLGACESQRPAGPQRGRAHRPPAQFRLRRLLARHAELGADRALGRGPPGWHPPRRADASLPRRLSGRGGGHGSVRPFPGGRVRVRLRLPARRVLVPEEACTIGEIRSALAESDIVVVDEQ